MKIVHICLACFYIENMEYQENVLPRKHKELGFDVSIISSTYTFTPDGKIKDRKTGSYINSSGILVNIINYNNKYGNFAKMFRIYNDYYSILSLEKPDIIFIHGLQFFSIRQIINYKKNNPNVIIYADNHGDFINAPVNTIKKKLLQRYIWGRCARSIVPYVEKIWGVTPLRERYLQQIYGIKPEKTGILVMGGDEKKIDFKNQMEIRRTLRKNNNINNTDFLIITGGKIDMKKNIHLLLEAVDSINNDSIKLVVIGVPSDEMKLVIDRFTCNSKVRFTGWLSADMVYNWFLAADLAIFPGTHSVLWEQAVASGIPCVFKAWEGMEHVDVGNNCCFLYKDSTKEIIDVLIKISLNNELYTNMKKNAVEKGIKSFSYIEIAKRSIGL